MTEDHEQRVWAEALALRPPVEEPVPADTVWRAVAGELEPEELEPLLDRLARDPDLQLAWRLARALDARPEAVRPPWSRWGVLVAIAASLVVAGGVWVGRGDPEASRGSPAVETRLTSRSALPRTAFVLEWDQPVGARAVVELRDGDLRVLGHSPPLSEGRWTVDPALLSTVGPGGAVVWRVTVEHAGEEQVSEAFVQVVAPR